MPEVLDTELKEDSMQRFWNGLSLTVGIPWFLGLLLHSAAMRLIPGRLLLALVPQREPGYAYKFLESAAWCQGYYANTASGNRTEALSEDAAAWDAEGALQYVYGQGWCFEHARSFVLQDLGVSSLQVWNDAPGRTQAEVVAAFRRARV